MTPKEMIDWLIEKGETTYSIADKIDRNQSNISRIQRGETTKPHPPTVKAIAAYYKKQVKKWESSK